MALSGLTEVGVLVSISNEDQTTGHGMFLRRNKLFNFLPEPVKVHSELLHQRNSDISVAPRHGVMKAREEHFEKHPHLP